MIFIISTWKGLILEIKQFKYFSAVLITTLIYVFTFATGCDAADNRSIKRAKGDSGGQRVALVIGNADYENGLLRNPVNDARAITQTLEKLNFEVIKGENLSQIQMRRAIDHFGRKLRGAEVGLFFYAGHGMAADGNNYLIPVGAKLADKPDVEYEAVKAGRVLAKMEGASTKLNLVLLDACRDNPFARTFRSSVSRGLAPMPAPSGSIIAYATAYGSVAADGSGKHSPFTDALLKNLSQPGLSVDRILKLTGASVSQATGGKQQPWISSNYYGEYVLKTRNAGNLHTPTSSDNPNQSQTATFNNLSVEKTRQEEFIIKDMKDRIISKIKTGSGFELSQLNTLSPYGLRKLRSLLEKNTYVIQIKKGGIGAFAERGYENVLTNIKNLLGELNYNVILRAKIVKEKEPTMDRFYEVVTEYGEKIVIRVADCCTVFYPDIRVGDRIKIFYNSYKQNKNGIDAIKIVKINQCSSSEPLNRPGIAGDSIT